MYVYLLCSRYLRTRYIALASIISVTLGVATMIVVNGVMKGFTHEMQGRIHGILSDVVFESHSAEGFHDPARRMAEIREIAGEYIAGMTPTVVVPAMLMYQVQGRWTTHPINLIGIDTRTHGEVSDFSQYLQHPENRKQLSFSLRESGYDTRDHQAGPDALPRERMEYAGWEYRRAWARYQAEVEAQMPQPIEAAAPEENATDENSSGENPTDENTAAEPAAADPFLASAANEPVTKFDPAKEQHTGVVIGIALASFRTHDGSDRFLTLPGDDVKITMPTAGIPPKPVDGTYTVVDFYESKMSEYDSNFVFVPIEELQRMRGTIDPVTKIGNATQIQIKLHDDADGNLVRDKLRAAFAPEVYGVYTWRDKQGPLLAAVNLETAILNILLFLIIAVAGFGILATFFMIVVEKTRDIGILKSLGASQMGVMGIFLAYGLTLGLVGSGVGLGIGLLFVAYINEIADVLAMVTGHQVFDPTIYYFQQIPTIVEPFTVACIVVGAMWIAVLASIIPACRAALLHPVEALRYE
jgi:lipoprotein-releasing system permease protein